MVGCVVGAVRSWNQRTSRLISRRLWWSAPSFIATHASRDHFPYGARSLACRHASQQHLILSINLAPTCCGARRSHGQSSRRPLRAWPASRSLFGHRVEDDTPSPPPPSPPPSPPPRTLKVKRSNSSDSAQRACGTNRIATFARVFCWPLRCTCTYSYVHRHSTMHMYFLAF